MKNIKITVEVDGNELSRLYSLDDPTQKDWNDPVIDMIATIDHSEDDL